MRDYYLVVIEQDGCFLYLEYETPGTLDKNGNTLTEPMGHFSNDISEAMKIRDKGLAEAIAHAYKDAKVISI